MVVDIIISSIINLIGLWNLIIAVLGQFPKCRSTAVGTLKIANSYRNVKTKSGRQPIPIMTRYTYTYTVKGKVFRHNGEVLASKQTLFPKVSMVYVKWFPRHAYPNKFKGTKEWTWAFISLLIGILSILSITIS